MYYTYTPKTVYKAHYYFCYIVHLLFKAWIRCASIPIPAFVAYSTEKRGRSGIFSHVIERMVERVSSKTAIHTVNNKQNVAVHSDNI